MKTEKKSKQKLADSLERIFNPRNIKDPRNESFWDMIHINLCPNLKFYSFSIFFSIFLLIIFVIQLATGGVNVIGNFLEPHHKSFTQIMLLEKSFIVAYKEYYRFFTATYVHRDIPCLSNSIILLLVWGSTMEYSFMVPRTIVTFVLTSMIGNAFGLYFSEPLEEIFMGADAGIFGLLGAGLGYIIFNWHRIKSKTSSKLSLFFMVTFIMSISMVFAPSVAIVMVQLGGCLSGIFVGMITAPLIGSKSKVQFEEHGFYENFVFLVGALLTLLTMFFLFTLLMYQKI